MPQIYGTIDRVESADSHVQSTEKRTRTVLINGLCLALGMVAMSAYQSLNSKPVVVVLENELNSKPTTQVQSVATVEETTSWTEQDHPSFLHGGVGTNGGGDQSGKASPDPDIKYFKWSMCESNCGDEDLTYPDVVTSSYHSDVDQNVLEYTLRVNKGRFEGPISWNHRAYDGKNTGPTFIVSPGDRVIIHLKNELEYPSQVEYTWTGEDYTVMTALGTCEPYGQPNVTSLHFHGLAIPSTGFGDGPFRMAGPGETITYDFSIDDDHPAGTFWYHSHYGMSHSLQVRNPPTLCLAVSGSHAHTPYTLYLADRWSHGWRVHRRGQLREWKPSPADRVRLDWTMDRA